MNERDVYIPTKIVNYVSEGELSPANLGVYMLLQLQADPRTGIWMGSAEKLQACFPTLDQEVVERNFTRLEEARLIQCYRQLGPQPGGKTLYSILIDNYVVTEGDFLGKKLAAWKSVGADSLVYEEVAA